MSQELDSLYREIILDHSKEPRNFVVMPCATLKREGFNPLCGDRVEISLKIQDGVIEDCAFQGEGCSICMASCSIMMDEITGQKVADVQNEIQQVRDLMQGKDVTIDPDSDLEALSGVKKFPVRIKCALLPWTTLKEGLDGRVDASQTE